MVKIKAKRKLVKASEANNNNNNPKIVKKLKKKSTKTTPKPPPPPVPVPADTSSDENSSESDSDDDATLSEPEIEDIKTLLEPYTKDQLIDLIAAAAVNDQSLYTRICDSADHDPVHRKIFVHGLGWDTTRESLTAAFESYGEIEECKVVTDRVTGKAKGFGFVLFKSRHGAMKALKEPRKKINNRIASCQLASLGPAPPASGDTTNRKIYVSNVQADVDSERLRSFFAKFGEIEIGPMGFDTATGKSRGFALFLYKTPEGARKALEEPHKVFEGHQLVCQMAADGKNKGNLLNTSMVVVPPVPAQTPPMLSAVAAAQNLALLGQHSALNPMYGGLFTNPNAGFIAPGQMGSFLTGQGLVGSSQTGSVGGAVGNVGTGYGGYGGARVQGLGSLGGNQSLLGTQGLGNLGGNQSLLGTQGLGSLGGNQSLLGTYGTSSGSVRPSLGLQHAYPSSQIGQSSAARQQGSSGSFGGYSTRM